MSKQISENTLVTAFIAYILECSSSLNVSAENLKRITSPTSNKGITINVGKLDTTFEERYRILASLMLFLNLHDGLFSSWSLSNPRTWSEGGSINILFSSFDIRTLKNYCEFIMPGSNINLTHIFITKWLHQDELITNDIITYDGLLLLLHVFLDQTDNVHYYRFILDFDSPRAPFFEPPSDASIVAKSFKTFYEKVDLFDNFSESNTTVSIEMKADNLLAFLNLPVTPKFSNLCRSDTYLSETGSIESLDQINPIQEDEVETQSIDETD